MEVNERNIYERASDGTVFSPFNLKIDGMQRLFLINFEKDPDEIYIGFEPQYIDSPNIGKGLRIIGWRRDGYVDVYQQMGLSMENKNFDVAGKGLSDLIQREMDGARLSITKIGVDCYFAFDDKSGRHIEVTIKEKGKKTARPFTLLAPVGSSSESPSALPVFLMYDFNFVRKRNTAVTIMIDGILHKPDSFPIPMNGSKVYFMRYSNDTFLASWNMAQSGPLSNLETKDGLIRDNQGTVYDLEENDSHMEIKQMKCSNSRHNITINFTPPVPDIVCLKDGSTAEGKFTISSDESAGTIDGEYQIGRNGGEAVIRIHPAGGWKPNESRWMVRLIYKAASMFKTWPKSYIWTGSIKLGGSDATIMHSSWQRLR